ncbi:MAG: hypothetical protein JSW40_09265 [Candidatus Omnitrophota bacterium]|nr:MAG: hypothetical protein JSW40_09265 [Candidatus Omnitrophota bacterium]
MINPRVSSLAKSTTLKIITLTKELIREGKDWDRLHTNFSQETLKNA